MLMKKLTTVIATGALVLGSITPAFAAGNTVVSGNGAVSDNTVNTTQNNNTTNTQTNNATISNTVTTTSNSGDNTASFNTGGTTQIQTGPSTNVTSISNAANVNQMSASDPCGCGSNPTSVGVSQNGAFSDNTVNATNNNNSTANQTNNALFTNAVNSTANTGGNTGDLNTGGGTSITTGPAANGTQIQNAANQNILVGGNAGVGAGTGSFFGLGGNGALSTNTINATTNNNSSASQANSAYFSNAVSSTATTGDNEANFGTGGYDSIMTGGATNITQVSNEANRNILDMGSDCGCTVPGLDKVVGDGAYSTGTINDNSNNNQTQAQANNSAFANAFDGSAASGGNSLADSTAFWGIDPSIMTGSTTSKTIVNNAANENVSSNNGVTLGGYTFSWSPASVLGVFGF